MTSSSRLSCVLIERRSENIVGWYDLFVTMPLGAIKADEGDTAHNL